jgi:hypothetical protein
MLYYLDLLKQMTISIYLITLIKKQKRYAPHLMIDPSQIACGFPPHTPVQRIMHDSFSDLYLSVKSYP